MNLISRIGTNVLVVAALSAALNVTAGPGHGHSDAVPVTGKSSPRFETHSDLFEAVGVLRASELSIMVDRYSSNEPLLNAKVELESGSTKLLGQFHIEHGDYSFAAKPFEKPGAYPITLTVTAGDDVDILAGNLIVPAADAHADGATPWRSRVAIGALIVGLAITFVAFLAFMLFMRHRSKRINHV